MRNSNNRWKLECQQHRFLMSFSHLTFALYGLKFGHTYCMMEKKTDEIVLTVLNSGYHLYQTHHMVDDKMHARSSGHTLLLHNNHWAVKTVCVSCLVRWWRFGTWGHSLPNMNVLRLNLMISQWKLNVWSNFRKVTIFQELVFQNHSMYWYNEFKSI
jgi:hypothetical protein